MNAREYGSMLKSLARRVRADYVPIPPSWTGTIQALGQSGYRDLAEAAVKAGAKPIGELCPKCGKGDAMVNGVCHHTHVIAETAPAPEVRPAPAVDDVKPSELVHGLRQEEPPPVEEKKPAAGERKAPVHVKSVPSPPAKGTVWAAFAARRTELHETRRKESEKGYRLMVEFIKTRRGDVNASEAAELMRGFGMPFPSRLYTMARDEAQVPLRKPICRKPPRDRAKTLMAEWRELLATTPDDQLPRYVDSLAGHEEKKAAPHPARNGFPAAPPPPTNGASQPAPTPAPTPSPIGLDASTAALLAELRRRKQEAQALLDSLKGVDL
jgi:hypothetical protein